MEKRTMTHRYRSYLLLASLTILATRLCAAGTPAAKAHAGRQTSAAESPTSRVSPSTLLREDFNGANPWGNVSATVAPGGGAAQVTWGDFGTIDVPGGTRNSGGLRLTVAGASARNPGNARLVSGLLPVRNSETNPGKLTLSFDYSVSVVHPIRVQVESFDAAKRRTGGRMTTLYTAAPDFYQRAAIDLSTMEPIGSGSFHPTDPFVQITLEIETGAAPAAQSLADTATGTLAPNPELRLDNVAYAVPAYYISPNGSDKNDGRTEKTAFADPQQAVERAQPGDIIVLMDGVYRRAATTPEGDGVIGMRRGGSPAAWIVLKNYPGAHPILASDGWNAIKIGRASTEKKTTEPALAYIEIRGLHIRGNALEAKEQHPDDMNEARASTNGNGISGDGRGETYPPHHLRFADNLVELCPGGGISTGGCDWVTTEGNEIRNNCWWNIYGCSGTSFLGAGNFDGLVGNYKVLIRNNRLFCNEGLVPWKQVKRMSDSNGIIIDSIQGFQGRVLIQSNLCVDNGGSGIHVFRGQRIDIVNNTAYMNGAAPLLRWGQIFVQSTDDARILNNILVSRPDQPVNTVSTSIDDKGNTHILRANNLYFGGGTPPIVGENDVIADPQFVHPTKDYRTADFHLKPDSPAIGKGQTVPFGPIRDLDGKARVASAPAKGAFEK